jgi:hypothetical protein
MSGFGPGVQHFPWPRDKGGRTSRSQRPHDIPRVHRHEAQAMRGQPKRVGYGTVRLGGWLEALNGVHGERPFEERSETRIRQLLLDCGGRRIGQGDEPQPSVTHSLKTVAHVRMGGKCQHPPGECRCGR